MSRFRFRARSTRGAAADVYAELEAAAIAAARANNVALWYIGRNLTEVFADSAGSTPAVLGGPVGLLRDRQYGIGSASGFHLSQATAANRPTIAQLSSGYFVLSLDGVSDHLISTVTNPVTSAPYTMIAGGVYQSPGVERMLVGDVLRRVGFVANGRSALQHRLGTSLVGTELRSGGEAVVLSATSSSSTETLHDAGALLASGNLTDPSGTASAVMVGQAGFGGAFFAGSIALAATATSALPPAARIAIERFAAHLVGVAYAG